MFSRTTWKKNIHFCSSYYIPFSSTIFFSFFRGHCVGKWFLLGKGHRCHQEAHLLWEEEGPDINRKSCAAELLLPLREGALKTMSARSLGLASRKRMHPGVCCAEEMISTTWPDFEQR